jgi:hypothetical protein
MKQRNLIVLLFVLLASACTPSGSIVSSDTPTSIASSTVTPPEALTLTGTATPEVQGVSTITQGPTSTSVMDATQAAEAVVLQEYPIRPSELLYEAGSIPNMADIEAHPEDVSKCPPMDSPDFAVWFNSVVSSIISDDITKRPINVLLQSAGFGGHGFLGSTDTPSEINGGLMVCYFVDKSGKKVPVVIFSIGNQIGYQNTLAIALFDKGSGSGQGTKALEYIRNGGKVKGVSVYLGLNPGYPEEVNQAAAVLAGENLGDREVAGYGQLAVENPENP